MQRGMSDVRTEVLDANGKAVIRGGTFFMLLETPAPLAVAFEGGGTTFGGSNLEAGYAIGPLLEAFDRVRITGPAGGSVKFMIGEGLADYRRTVGVFELRKATAGSQGNVGITNGANGVQIRAADSTRRILHVFNNAPAGGDTVYAGYGATLVAADGIPIPPQQERSFAATDQVRAIALVAGPINTRWQEERD